MPDPPWAYICAPLSYLELTRPTLDYTDHSMSGSWQRQLYFFQRFDLTLQRRRCYSGPHCR
jgi:hypothetical protein